MHECSELVVRGKFQLVSTLVSEASLAKRLNNPQGVRLILFWHGEIKTFELGRRLGSCLFRRKNSSMRLKNKSLKTGD